MAQTTGKIIRLITEKGFGFIKSDSDNTEYFFHQSGIRDDFHALREGQQVMFEPTKGPKGLRAEQVSLV